MMKKLLFIPVFLVLVSSAFAQWNGGEGLSSPLTGNATDGYSLPGPLAIPTLTSGASTYGSAGTSVTIDLSKSWHYVNLTPATSTTGVSVLWTNTPTLTSQNRTVYISLKQAGSVAGRVVWTGATEHDSGTSPTLTTTVGARDVFAVVLSSETGTTKTVHPAGSGIK